MKKIAFIFSVGMLLGVVFNFMGYGILTNPIAFFLLAIPGAIVNIIIADKLFGEDC